MSTVSLNAGDTSWTDKVTCDSCGSTVERKPTGEMRVATKSIIPGEQRYMPGVVEYEDREFDEGALEGWGIFETRKAQDVDDRPRMDLCPHCAAVVQDWLLERVKDPHSNAPFGKHEEKEYGTVRPASPTAHMTTNLSAARELGAAISEPTGQSIAAAAVMGGIRGMVQAIGDSVRSGAPGLSAPRLVDRFGAPLPVRCIGRMSLEGSLDGRCANNAMTGGFYCYTHAARER